MKLTKLQLQGLTYLQLKIQNAQKELDEALVELGCDPTKMYTVRGDELVEENAEALKDETQ